MYDHISKILKLGEEQFEPFWIDRLFVSKIPLSDPISWNLLNLPGNQNKATEKDRVLTAAIMEKLKRQAKHELN